MTSTEVSAADFLGVAGWPNSSAAVATLVSFPELRGESLATMRAVAETRSGAAGRSAYGRQVHSADVVRVGAAGFAGSCDGLITDRTDLVLSVQVADCVPILVVDAERRVIAAVHAGWRGTAAAIAERTIESLQEEFGILPENLEVLLGPSIRKCCYKVGAEVAGQFHPQAIHSNGGAQLRLDLAGENTRQLCAKGVPTANIAVSPHCTHCSPLRLPSFRRDRKSAGRLFCFLRLSAPDRESAQ